MLVCDLHTDKSNMFNTDKSQTVKVYLENGKSDIILKELPHL